MKKTLLIGFKSYSDYTKLNQDLTDYLDLSKEKELITMDAEQDDALIVRFANEHKIQLKRLGVTEDVRPILKEVDKVLIFKDKKSDEIDLLIELAKEHQVREIQTFSYLTNQFITNRRHGLLWFFNSESKRYRALSM